MCGSSLNDNSDEHSIWRRRTETLTVPLVPIQDSACTLGFGIPARRWACNFVLHIYIYNSVELNSSVRKLLPKLAYHRCETPGYYRVPHGGGRRGGRRAPEECATQFLSITEKEAMFFIRLQMAYTRFCSQFHGMAGKALSLIWVPSIQEGHRFLAALKRLTQRTSRWWLEKPSTLINVLCQKNGLSAIKG